METTTPATMVGAASTFTARVPLAVARRGGRKVIVAPIGEVMDRTLAAALRPSVVGPAVKVLDRALWWRDMLESAAHTGVRDLAGAENVNESYFSRIVRLTLICPEIIGAALPKPNISLFKNYHRRLGRPAPTIGRRPPGVPLNAGP